MIKLLIQWQEPQFIEQERYTEMLKKWVLDWVNWCASNYPNDASNA